LLDIQPDDEGRHIAECQHGHTQIVALRQQNFEILFELAAYAIRDKNYRQSVSSCMKSLKAFQEFFLRSMAYQNGIKKERFDAAWKLLGISRQNRHEAYLLNYLNFCSRPPVLLTASQSEWKDSVMQKRILPTREECVSFGQAVLNVLRSAVEDTRDAFPHGVKLAMQEQVPVVEQHAFRPVARWSILTIVNLSAEGDEYPYPTLENALARMI
jgi:hypothetical protein